MLCVSDVGCGGVVYQLAHLHVHDLISFQELIFRGRCTSTEGLPPALTALDTYLRTFIHSFYL